jgi:hypothetical protein
MGDNWRKNATIMLLISRDLTAKKINVTYMEFDRTRAIIMRCMFVNIEAGDTIEKKESL